MRRCDYSSGEAADGMAKGSFVGDSRATSPGEGIGHGVQKQRSKTWHQNPRARNDGREVVSGYPGGAVRAISTADSAAKRQNQEHHFLEYL